MQAVAVYALLVIGAPSLAYSANNSISQAKGRDDHSPWGVASGAEWFSAYPTFNPLLKQAGVRWLRGFYEWQILQPRRGEWNFDLADRLVENARANGIHLTSAFAYLAPWASSDGGTRRFPIKDIQFWRDYVKGMVGRYHSDIKYWEVWNEFNGSFAENGSPEIYAQLIREASLTAKKIDPTVQIGLSVANFDVGFIDAVIKAGAANYFDYVCVHPYELLASLSDGGEPAFLNMAPTLRKMLAANGQPQKPLWITEIGSGAPVTRDDTLDSAQAASLAKAYLLAIASGFERVFWFEARGPSYDNNRDFGLIRPDMTRRPSYNALKVLTNTLGPEPTSAGWLNLDGAYGFLFDSHLDSQQRVELAAWAPSKKEISVTFESDVRVTNLAGENRIVPAGRPLVLTDVPILITGVPPALIEKARVQSKEPYPWGSNLSGTAVATAELGTSNTENGVKQVNSPTTIAEGDFRRTDFSRTDKEGHYVYFWVDPQFAPFGTNAFEITAVVRRLTPDKLAGMSIDYESRKGYVSSGYQNVPESGDWEKISWRVEDANFVGAWGWNFRLNAISSPNEFLIKEIIVKKVQ